MDSSIFYPFDTNYFVSHVFWLSLSFAFFYCICLFVTRRIHDIADERERNFLQRHNRIEELRMLFSDTKKRYEDTILLAEKVNEEAFSSFCDENNRKSQSFLKEEEMHNRLSLVRLSSSQDFSQTEQVNKISLYINNYIMNRV